jgi:hypothetical protein
MSSRGMKLKDYYVFLELKRGKNGKKRKKLKIF